MHVVSNKFGFSGNTFAAEMSDLIREVKFNKGQPWSNIGGKQQGISVTSCKTGKTVRYYLNKIVRERAVNEIGDVQAWELLPVPADLTSVPQARGTKVVIYND